MRKEYKIVLSALLISSAVFAIYKIRGLSKVTVNSLRNNSPSIDSQEEMANEIVAQKLTILENRCRGCGKCVRIDPEHFEMNMDSRKAMVISSRKLDSTNLSLAINNCLDQAISLK